MDPVTSQIITSLGCSLLKTIGSAIQSKVAQKNHHPTNQKVHPTQLHKQKNHHPSTNNPEHKNTHAHEPVKPNEVKVTIMDERWISIVKLEQPFSMFKKAFNESEAIKEIRKHLNCNVFNLRRVYLKKNFKGYLYWLHISVNEIGNQGQHTLQLREINGKLECIDIEHSLLSIKKSPVGLPPVINKH